MQRPRPRLPALTLVPVAQQRKASKSPAPRLLLPLLPHWLFGTVPRPLAPPLQAAVVGGVKTLHGDRVPWSSRVLPPKLPNLLRPRPPLLQPRLGRLPGRLLQALFYTKELGGGRDPVPAVWRAPGQHQHARGAELHQQWAGHGREGTLSPALSHSHSLINQLVNECVN